MTLGTGTYTLVGFSAEVDWRPLRFVEPIPPHRFSTACGIVCKRTALLPCEHTLCQLCCEHYGKDDALVCPLHGREFEAKDLNWRDLDADNLLNSQVYCWNKEYGCDTVKAASKICRHFLSECGHQSVPCPKCSARILRRDVCSHLVKKCAAETELLEPEDKILPLSKDDKALLAPFRAAFENQAAEVRAFHERIALLSDAHEDRLEEISLSIRTLKETVQGELTSEALQRNEGVINGLRSITLSIDEVKTSLTTHSDKINDIPSSMSRLERELKTTVDIATRGTKAHITKTARDIKSDAEQRSASSLHKIKQARREVEKLTRDTRNHVTDTGRETKTDERQCNESCLGKTMEVLRHTQLQVGLCNFCVPGVGALQEETLRDGWAVYENEKVYLRGYCISPGVRFNNNFGSVELCPLYELHMDDMDNFVRWPFSGKIRMSITHPRNGSRWEIELHLDQSKEYVQRPTEKNMSCVYLPENSIHLNELIKEGYVEEDMLRIQWEVLQ